MNDRRNFLALRGEHRRHRRIAAEADNDSRFQTIDNRTCLHHTDTKRGNALHLADNTFTERSCADYVNRQAVKDMAVFLATVICDNLHTVTAGHEVLGQRRCGEHMSARTACAQ